MTAVLIGVAYPVTDHDRAALLAEYPTCRLPPAPSGGVVRRCARCPILIGVGPRLAAARVRVVCAACAFALGMRQINRGRAWV